MLPYTGDSSDRKGQSLWIIITVIIWFCVLLIVRLIACLMWLFCQSPVKSWPLINKLLWQLVQFFPWPHGISRLKSQDHIIVCQPIYLAEEALCSAIERIVAGPPSQSHLAFARIQFVWLENTACVTGRRSGGDNETRNTERRNCDCC